jgi:hypothetical protein
VWWRHELVVGPARREQVEGNDVRNSIIGRVQRSAALLMASDGLNLAVAIRDLHWLTYLPKISQVSLTFLWPAYKRDKESVRERERVCERERERE